MSQKNDYNSKISEIGNKVTTDHDHDKYIPTQEFNKLISENFNAILAQAKLGSISEIASLGKKLDFNEKLKNVTSNKNELDELSKKVRPISTKGFTEDLTN